MSLIKTKSFQIGYDASPTNNFTIYQPATPDGTLRLGSGNSGSVTDAVIIKSNGNVGIGTSSPTNLLTIGGNTGGIDVSGWNDNRIVLRQYFDATYYQRIVFDAASRDFRIQSNSADSTAKISFWTGSNGTITERMRLDTSGNLGLGVTPSAWLSTRRALQVGSAAALSSITTASSRCDVSANMYLDGSSTFAYINSNYATMYRQDVGTHQWYTAPSGTAGNAISFTQAMTLDASGNLGLGQTGTMTEALEISRTTDPKIRFVDVGNTDAKIGIVNSTALGFEVGGSEKMRVDSFGNVGIGTSSPGYPISIYANGTNLATAQSYHTGDGVTCGTNYAFFGTNTTASQIQFVKHRGTSSSPTVTVAGDGIGLLRYQAFDGTSLREVARIGTNVESVAGTDDIAGYIRFYTRPSGAGAGIVERMRIDASGNLLVGTTSNSSPFDSCKVGIDTTLDGIRIRAGDGTTGVPLRFLRGGTTTTVGSVTTTTTATAYNTSSDYRLKENIQPMQNALEVVQQLNPVTYTWKADGSDGQGFIAHELQAVVPDCVTGEKDAVDAEGNPVYQGVDTSFLVATLTKAIQEQQATIQSLQARLDAAGL